MKRITCIIIDDEEVSIEGTREHIEISPILQLIQVFDNPFEALSFVQKNEVGLIFSDINMEEMSGMEFAKLVSNKIIFTTAHDGYALESYNLENVVGYLVKPITTERFQLAIRRALNNSIMPKKEVAGDLMRPRVLVIRTEQGARELDIGQINFVEANGDYSIIFYGPEKILCSSNLRELEDKLPDGIFKRVHRSFIINSTKVVNRRFDKVILDNGQAVPVGRTYRAQH